MPAERKESESGTKPPNPDQKRLQRDLERSLMARGLRQCPRCGRWLAARQISPMSGMCRDWSDCLHAVLRLEPEAGR
jgi:hypothetical protein